MVMHKVTTLNEKIYIYNISHLIIIKVHSQPHEGKSELNNNHEKKVFYARIFVLA